MRRQSFNVVKRELDTVLDQVMCFDNTDGSNAVSTVMAQQQPSFVPSPYQIQQQQQQQQQQQSAAADQDVWDAFMNGAYDIGDDVDSISSDAILDKHDVWSRECSKAESVKNSNSNSGVRLPACTQPRLVGPHPAKPVPRIDVDEVLQSTTSLLRDIDDRLSAMKRQNVSLANASARKSTGSICDNNGIGANSGSTPCNVAGSNRLVDMFRPAFLNQQLTQKQQQQQQPLLSKHNSCRNSTVPHPTAVSGFNEANIATVTTGNCDKPDSRRKASALERFGASLQNKLSQPQHKRQRISAFLRNQSASIRSSFHSDGFFHMPEAASAGGDFTSNISSSSGGGGDGQAADMSMAINTLSCSSVNSLPGTDGSASRDTSSQKIRYHQDALWNTRYQELVEFREQYGHCSVPHTHPNSALSQWVKRQRYQHKLKMEGKHTTMTNRREKALQDIGFCWDSHSALWDERFGELLQFRQQHGHCVVPARYEANQPLAIWTKCQRRQYKLLATGKRSNMTQERINRLNAVGFVWNPRGL